MFQVISQSGRVLDRTDDIAQAIRWLRNWKQATAIISNGEVLERKHTV